MGAAKPTSLHPSHPICTPATLHTQTYTHAHAYAHTCAHTRIHPTQQATRAHTHTRTDRTHTCTHTHAYTHTHGAAQQLHTAGPGLGNKGGAGGRTAMPFLELVIKVGPVLQQTWKWGGTLSRHDAD